MKRRGPQLAQSGETVGCTRFFKGQSICRKYRIPLAHDPIALHFGQNRGGGGHLGRDKASRISAADHSELHCVKISR